MTVSQDYRHDSPAPVSSAQGAPSPPGEAERNRHWLVVAKQEAALTEGEVVVIDLSNVERIDSNELSELIRLQLSARSRGGSLMLKNAHENLQKVFAMTRLDRLIEMRLPMLTEPVPAPPRE